MRKIVNKKKIICFDLDNVLCKTKSNDYKKSIPIKKNINTVNTLYKKGYYQEFHRHDHKIYQYVSGVVYLTEDNSDIHFFINNTFEYTPKIGNIIIFDSHIEHRVVANKKDSLRISLAFNFRKCQSY